MQNLPDYFNIPIILGSRSWLMGAFLPPCAFCSPWTRSGGLEGEAVSQAGSDEKAEVKAEGQMSSDVGCKTGPTGVPVVGWAGQGQ
jgi:hypothetical protein